MEPKRGQPKQRQPNKSNTITTGQTRRVKESERAREKEYDTTSTSTSKAKANAHNDYEDIYQQSTSVTHMAQTKPNLTK